MDKIMNSLSGEDFLRPLLFFFFYEIPLVPGLLRRQSRARFSIVPTDPETG